MLKKLTVLSLLACAVLSAPLSTTTEPPKGTPEIKLDLPVAQLEKLKQNNSGPVKPIEDMATRVEDHAKADGQKTLGHSQYTLPAQVVPKEIAQDGDKVAFDGVVPTVAPAGDDQEPTTKVFHGAARLISQASSAQHTPPPPPAVPAAPAHTAHRRSPNDGDYFPELAMTAEHLASLYAMPAIAQDIAQYVFKTGDEMGVTMALEQMLQQGKMSKEEAIAFLQETKYYIDFLNSHFNMGTNLKTHEDQERIRHFFGEQATQFPQENYQLNPPAIPASTNPASHFRIIFGKSTDSVRPSTGMNYKVGKLNVPPVGPVGFSPVSIKFDQDPTLFKQIPAEYKQFLGEYKQFPAEHKQFLGEYKQIPAVYKNPAEYKQFPAEYNPAPGVYRLNPAENKQFPAEFNPSPGIYKQIPAEFNPSPGVYKFPAEYKPVLPVENQQMPVFGGYRQGPMKRTQYLDPMLQTNIISTSDYDRDGNVVSDEEYEEMMEKLKSADTLYTEYTLEEIIYQLAKMMFSQSLSRDPREARANIQRFMDFLELEAERGQLSKNIEKKVLDVMIAALTDAIGDRSETMQPQEPSATQPGDRLPQYLEGALGDSGMSRAILGAYKDELQKGPMHKLPYNKQM